MKNIIKVIIPLAVFLILLIVSIVSFNNENNIYYGLYNSDETYFKTDTAIAIMYETDNGNYEVSDGTSWLLDGYKFNENLSGCENGGTISWNDATQKVEMKTNISDKCYIYFDKYLSVQITNVTASNITSNSITVNVSATPGTNQISKYYYSINNGSSYTVSSNSSYTFTGLDKGTKYNIKVYAVDTKNYSSNIYSLSVTTEIGPTLADYIINDVYESDGVNGLYYHDGVGSYTNANQEAGDNSYRYSGANPNNYVCFGDSVPCSSADLYRIIGVFGKNVKLIFNAFYGTLPWGGSSWEDNVWANSGVNTDSLNDSYLNGYLDKEWSDKIITTNWKVGGNTFQNIEYNSAKSVFNYEVGNNSLSTTYSAKIGLMYVSDYAYAASPNNWETTMINYNSSTNTSNNWLFMNAREWTISPMSDDSELAYVITDTGQLTAGAGWKTSFRPTFYLNSNVIYISGTGTESDPYRIS